MGTTIQEYLNNCHKYKVDHTYQRPPNAWSVEDNQCLIDTILRGEPMPIFFMNDKSITDGVYYVVDGQQRLNAIKKFHENKIKLNKEFSGPENHSKTFNGENPINDKQRENFLKYKLSFFYMENYDDERVRLIFSRLQRGKPLQLGERLNAKPGEIVVQMREIAKHPFMQKSVGISQDRYGSYPDAARILFYEKYRNQQCGSQQLYDFFDTYKDLSRDSKEVKTAISTLNFLALCFPPEPGNYRFLEKHAWVFSVYTMVRDLRLSYSLQGEEKHIRDFIQDFHNKVYSEDFRNSKIDYQRFYNNIRGGWSEKIITLRRDTLMREFLQKYSVSEIDMRRQISDEEKITAFDRLPDPKSCPICHHKFKDFREPEYHHKQLHSEGGKTELGNIVVLCKKCHDEIHGKAKIELPSEEEISESEE